MTTPKPWALTQSAIPSNAVPDRSPDRSPDRFAPVSGSSGGKPVHYRFLTGTNDRTQRRIRMAEYTVTARPNALARPDECTLTVRPNAPVRSGRITPDRAGNPPPHPAGNTGPPRFRAASAPPARFRPARTR
ncbi:hypothetical protein GCM10009760_57030 [Kitasatospora kazusensis]|uniref:Uncharacterized protein n=1 Tax=Kitasatospora kazusensis TaxID=407974 RepID=A0ABP5M147_9ACTN